MNKIRYFFFRYSILLILCFIISIITTGNILQSAKPIESTDVISSEYVASLKAAAAGIDVHSEDLQSIQQTGIASSATASSATASSVTASNADTSSIGAYLVDGKVVPMIQSQVDELETKLSECKSQEEIKALMSNVAYYNKGIDYSGYEWYWESLKAYYTDEQIAILRSPRTAVKMPNIIGMDYRKAYDCLTDLGLVVRITFYYNPNSNLPIGCIYNQDANPGCKAYTDINLGIYAQAPTELYSDVSVTWDPNDEDFDIYQVVADLRENGAIAYMMPNIVGMSEQDAVSALKNAGAKNVEVYYEIGDPSIAPGTCLRQSGNPGSFTTSNYRCLIFIQEFPKYVTIPDVVGLSETEAVAALDAAGFQTIEVPAPGTTDASASAETTASSESTDMTETQG